MFARPFSSNFMYSKSRISLKSIKQLHQPNLSTLKNIQKQEINKQNSFLKNSNSKGLPKTSNNQQNIENRSTKSLPAYNKALHKRQSLKSNSKLSRTYQSNSTKIQSKILIKKGSQILLTPNVSQINLKRRLIKSSKKNNLFKAIKTQTTIEYDKGFKNQKSIKSPKGSISTLNTKKLIKKNILECYEELKIKYNEIKHQFDKVKSMQNLEQKYQISKEAVSHSQTQSQTKESINPESKNLIQFHSQTQQTCWVIEKQIPILKQIGQIASQTSIKLQKSMQKNTLVELNNNMKVENSANKIQQEFYYKNECNSLQKQLQFAYTTVLQLKKEIQKINKMKTKEQQYPTKQNINLKRNQQQTNSRQQQVQYKEIQKCQYNQKIKDQPLNNKPQLHLNYIHPQNIRTDESIIIVSQNDVSSVQNCSGSQLCSALSRQQKQKQVIKNDNQYNQVISQIKPQYRVENAINQLKMEQKQKQQAKQEAIKGFTIQKQNVPIIVDSTKSNLKIEQYINKPNDDYSLNGVSLSNQDIQYGTLIPQYKNDKKSSPIIITSYSSNLDCQKTIQQTTQSCINNSQEVIKIQFPLTQVQSYPASNHYNYSYLNYSNSTSTTSPKSYYSYCKKNCQINQCKCLSDMLVIKQTYKSN